MTKVFRSCGFVWSTLFIVASGLLLVGGCIEEPSGQTSVVTQPDAKPAEAPLVEVKEKSAEELEREQARRIARNQNVINQLYSGMSLSEANKIIGKPGVRKRSMKTSAGAQRLTYEWNLEGNITIQVTFEDDRLKKKEVL